MRISCVYMMKKEYNGVAERTTVRSFCFCRAGGYGRKCTDFFLLRDRTRNENEFDLGLDDVYGKRSKGDKLI